MSNQNLNDVSCDFSLPVNDLAPIWGVEIPTVHTYLKSRNINATISGNKSYLTPELTRKAMLSRGYQYPHLIVSLQMLKGGVGKTTTTMNIAIRANMYGARVLLIDLDQQANLSFAFGINNSSPKVWADLLEGKTTIKEMISHLSPTLDLIPSNLNNSILDRLLLNGRRDVSTGISHYLEEIEKDYDLILIDTSPNLSAINTAAACIADLIILPSNPDKFSFDGLQKTIEDLDALKKEFKLNFKAKVLFTKFDAREMSSPEMLKLHLEYYSDLMFRGFIRTSSELKNTIRSGSNIFARKNSAKEDYDILTREILGLLN